MNTQELISNNPKLQDLMDLIRDGRIKPISETAYLYIFKFSEVSPILQLCQLFGVGRTSYYDWLNRKGTNRILIWQFVTRS